MNQPLPRRSFDLAIDFVLDTQLPKPRNFPTKHPHRQALKDFIDTNVARGLLRQSKSPVGPPSFLKKTGELRLYLVPLPQSVAGELLTH
jgi:hypothetical protein